MDVNLELICPQGIFDIFRITTTQGFVTFCHRVLYFTYLFRSVDIYILLHAFYPCIHYPDVVHRLEPELSLPGSARPPHGDAQVAAEVHVEQGRPGHTQGQQSGGHKELCSSKQNSFIMPHIIRYLRTLCKIFRN